MNILEKQAAASNEASSVMLLPELRSGNQRKYLNLACRSKEFMVLLSYQRPSEVLCGCTWDVLGDALDRRFE